MLNQLHSLLILLEGPCPSARTLGKLTAPSHGRSLNDEQALPWLKLLKVGC